MTLGNAAADEESDELAEDDSRALPLVADSDSEEDSDAEDPDDDSDSGDDDPDDPDDAEDSEADDDSAGLEPDGDVGVEDSVLAAAEPSVVSGAWLDGVDDDGDGVAEEDDDGGELVVTGVDVVGLLVAEVTGASRWGAGVVLVAAGSGAGSGATGSGARVCFGASAVGSWVG